MKYLIYVLTALAMNSAFAAPLTLEGTSSEGRKCQVTFSSTIGLDPAPYEFAHMKQVNPANGEQPLDYLWVRTLLNIDLGRSKAGFLTSSWFDKYELPLGDTVVFRMTQSQFDKTPERLTEHAHHIALTFTVDGRPLRYDEGLFRVTYHSVACEICDSYDTNCDCPTGTAWSEDSNQLEAADSCTFH